MVIAIDFDGTIVENRYPEIGEPKLFAFETLLQLQKKHHQLILWTTRTGKRLDEAVRFCEERGIDFYAVNKSYPDERFDDIESRKIICDVFVSSKNFGGLPGWGEIWQELQRLEGGAGYSGEPGMQKENLLQRITKLFNRS